MAKSENAGMGRKTPFMDGHLRASGGAPMKAKVAERGQVTIPKALRKRLGIVPGTVLDFIEEQGRLIAKKTEAVDAVDQVFGRLGRGRNTDDIIQEIRGAK
jgi:AbrB family looped-hinge helix DNA binding protein